MYGMCMLCVCTVLSGRINDSAFVRIVCVRARVGAGWDGCAALRGRQNDNKREKKENRKLFRNCAVAACI